MFDTREGVFYLVVKPGKWNSDLKARLATKLPALEVGEVPIKLEVKVPRALFQRPQLQATITVPEDAVTPPVLDAQVLDNVKEVMQQQTGMDITFRVVKAIDE